MCLLWWPDYIRHLFSPEPFDVIFATGTLHHLYSSSNRVSEDQVVFNTYSKIIKKMFGELKAGRRLRIHESQRYTIARHLLYWNKSIHWHDKQQATDWYRVLHAAGFRNIKTHYYVPYKLRKFSPVLKNVFANFLLKSVYTITAVRP